MPGTTSLGSTLPRFGQSAVRLSVAVTLLATLAAALVGEIVFRFVADLGGPKVRLAIMATSMIVATPIVATLVRVMMQIRVQVQDLATREELLLSAQRYAKVGYWEFNSDNGRLRMSDALHDLPGDEERKLTLTLPVLLGMASPEDRERLAATFHRILVGRSPERIEFRLNGPDGQERSIWANGARVLGPDGEPACIYGLYMDVTERRATEAALRESEDHHRHAVELSPLIPWVEDADGNTLEVSPRWFELTGRPVEESLGTGWVEALHPDDLEATQAPWQEALRTGQPYEVEHRVRVADGSYRWFRSRASARRNDNGEIIRWYGTVEDIHDRKLAEVALRESETFASSILESTADCVMVLDLEGRVQYVNRPGLRTLQIDHFELISGQPWPEFWPVEVRPLVEESLSTAKGGDVGRFAGFCPTAQGTPKWWDVCVSPIPGTDGIPGRLLSISRDITASRAAQEELERAREEAVATAQKLRAVLESTTDSVMIIDRNWQIQFLNERAQEQVGQLKSAIGRNLWDVFPDARRSTFGRELARAIETRQQVSFEEFYSPLNMWVEVHVYPSEDGLSIFFSDVSARRKALETLQHAALHDSLTDLLNRSAFRERLVSQLEVTDRHFQTAVLFLDLDEFKSVNDAMGHPAGDQLLREAAARLRACLRDTDLIARFGGDEFAVMQTAVDQPEQIEYLAQRIISRLSRPYRLEGREVAVGASMGIAVAEAPGHTADDLLKKADIALYRAKAGGKGIYRFFEAGMDQAAEEDQRLRADLRDALTRGEFHVYYQPVVGLETLRVSAFEALVRWRHPQRGLLSPGEFISLAETTRAIDEIGAWVLQEACARAARWPTEISISVNLSPRQFRGRKLAPIVAEVLRSTGLAACRLQLEITESALLQDEDSVCQSLEALRGLGVRISIDDFGTGYSSLGYLRRFSVDNIKIDRTFVADLADNPRTQAILRVLMALGRDLGVSLTAEGVETPVQLEKLIAQGCQQGQGYLFGHPMPGDEAEALMLSQVTDFNDAFS